MKVKTTRLQYFVLDGREKNTCKMAEEPTGKRSVGILRMR
jgi:hypothetical protein